MNSPSPAAASKMSGFGRWMALLAALLGWMFDGAEMGLFSMVGRDAIKDLMTRSESGPPANAEIDFYYGVVVALFLVGAATGGVLFGWLGDRLGRVRAMSLSVITYAVFTGFCGIANSPLQIAILRFIASLGMGGEWALGVSLVMEVWPNRSRALMAGLIGAAANVGYLLVGVIGIWLNATLHIFEKVLTDVGFAEATVNSLVANKGWRIMMLLGTAPAVLTFFFRLFVPESEKWEHEQTKGTTSNWATQDLIGVLIGVLGPVLIVAIWAYEFPGWAAGAVMGVRIAGSVLGVIIAAVGYIYPVRRFLRRISENDPVMKEKSGKIIRRMLLGAGLSGVALMGTWGATQWAAAWAGKMTADLPEIKNPREWTQISLAVGAIIGTICAALMGDWLGRRITYFFMCVLSLASGLALYQLNTQYDSQFLLCALIAGVCSASFYGWLPLYLPELFSTQVRATGQGFSFNFGRIIAAVGALQAGALFKSAFTTEQHFAGLVFRAGHPGACSVICFIYVVGMVLIWFAPETKGQPLPE